MARKSYTDQRVKVEPGYNEWRSLVFRITRPHAWVAFLGGLAIAALLDLVTGDRVWIGPVYLCVLGLGAWALGLLEAITGLVFVLGFSYFANSGAIYPFHANSSLWDLVIRVPPALVIMFLLANARHSVEREWQLARTDPLTGALNRKAFFELAGTIEESRTWHMLAYADLDGLKRLNDREGHARGDQSLKAFASQVAKAIRKDDVFARVGGDEFLVYMAVRDECAGLNVARRLHRSMNKVTTEFGDGLRCSVGVLILAPGQRWIDPELRAADELMYEAKQRGGALAMAIAHHRGGKVALSERLMVDLLQEAGETPLRLQSTADSPTAAAKGSHKAAA